MLAKAGEPLFLAAWDRAVFIHYEADPSLLQRQIPFELDLPDGRTFVSIVATEQWWRSAECVGANYAPGVEVWMGGPHRIAD